jgi:hypothetical protein
VASRPENLGDSPDCRVVFAFETLRGLLESIGFEASDDVCEDPCHHLTTWAPYIENLCLDTTARMPRVEL